METPGLHWVETSLPAGEMAAYDGGGVAGGDLPRGKRGPGVICPPRGRPSQLAAGVRGKLHGAEEGRAELAVDVSCFWVCRRMWPCPLSEQREMHPGTHTELGPKPPHLGRDPQRPSPRFAVSSVQNPWKDQAAESGLENLEAPAQGWLQHRPPALPCRTLPHSAHGAGRGEGKGSSPSHPTWSGARLGGGMGNEALNGARAVWSARGPGRAGPGGREGAPCRGALRAAQLLNANKRLQGTCTQFAPGLGCNLPPDKSQGEGEGEVWHSLLRSKCVWARCSQR